MATVKGLVDIDTGLAAPIGTAGYAVVAADTPNAARAGLELSTAATMHASAFAAFEDGQKGVAAYNFGDHRAADYVTVDAVNAMIAVSGENLTMLPPPYAVVGAATQTIANAITPTIISSLTIPAGKLRHDGQRLSIYHAGRYVNNTGAVNGFTLEVLINNVVVWTSSTAPAHLSSAGNPRMLAVDMALDRRSPTTAQLRGQVSLAVASTEFGDLTSTASRATPFLGAVAGEPLLALDFSATIVIAVRMTLSVAAVTHTYTAIRSDAYCDRDVFVATPPPPTVLTLDWLEDLPVYNPSIIQPTLLPNTTGYPRLSTGTIKTFAMSDNQLSMFDVTCSKLATAMADGITASQAINATQMHAREWSPVAIQSYKDAVGSNVSGLAFVSIGPSTTEDILFAGHILYSGGRATLNAAITATATTVAVTNSSALKAGAYGVIRPAGSWATAELVYVASVSAANATATITRAYKSTARDHVAGEIIQMVEPMAADAPEGFGLNLSNACPVDGNGNKLNQALATIMAAYHDKTATLGALTCHVDGILWDSDWKYIFHKGADNADVDLDGVTDHGINLATGRNMWGDGLVDLSVNLRAALNARGLTGTIVMSGDMKACNQTVNAGGQFEGFRQVYSETGSGTANNDYFPRDFSALKNAMMTSGYGPQFFWDLQLKDGTQAYPGAGSATSNAPFRFGLGTALLFGASISCQNRPGSTVPLVPAEPWMWWDEYSVSTVPGADYGTAAAHTNFTALRAGVHWLGLPTGPARRLYDSEFEIEHNLITNGDFDVNTTGWSGTRITLSRDTAEKVNGTHSLKGVLTLPLTTHAASGAIITGQTINLTSGQHYTLCFAIASEYDRFVQPQVSNALTCKGLFIPGGSVWSRQVWSFRAPANSNEALRLNVGGIGGALWVDQVRFFSGNADLFRRDFDQGIVIVNASPIARTVDLGGTFQRIQGTGQDPVNNGATLTAVTVPAWDAAILVRPEV